MPMPGTPSSRTSSVSSSASTFDILASSATRHIETGERGSATGAWQSAMPLLAPMTDQRRFAVIILAAGQGTRMRSDTHKVLHPIASRPLLLHLLDRVDGLGADKRIVVVGKGRDQVEQAPNGREGTGGHPAQQPRTGDAAPEA